MLKFHRDNGEEIETTEIMRGGGGGGGGIQGFKWGCRCIYIYRGTIGIMEEKMETAIIS